MGEQQRQLQSEQIEGDFKCRWRIRTHQPRFVSPPPRARFKPSPQSPTNAVTGQDNGQRPRQLPLLCRATLPPAQAWVATGFVWQPSWRRGRSGIPIGAVLWPPVWR